MGLPTVPFHSASPPDRSGHGPAHWLDMARQVAQDLATGAMALDLAAARLPFVLP